MTMLLEHGLLAHYHNGMQSMDSTLVYLTIMYADMYENFILYNCPNCDAAYNDKLNAELVDLIIRESYAVEQGKEKSYAAFEEQMKQMAMMQQMYNMQRRKNRLERTVSMKQTNWGTLLMSPNTISVWGH